MFMLFSSPLTDGPRHSSEQHPKDVNFKIQSIWGVAKGSSISWVAKGPLFHGSQCSRKIKLQNASCQMGGRKVTGRQNCFSLQEKEWLQPMGHYNPLKDKAANAQTEKNTHTHTHSKHTHTHTHTHSKHNHDARPGGLIGCQSGTLFLGYFYPFSGGGFSSFWARIFLYFSYFELEKKKKKTTEPEPPNFGDNHFDRRNQTLPFFCNLCGHLQRCQMPDIENSRKTAEKGAEWVKVKQPKNSRKNSRNTQKTVFCCFSGVSAVFRLCYRDPLGTLFGCFQCRAFGTSVGGRRDCNPSSFTKWLKKRPKSDSHAGFGQFESLCERRTRLFWSLGIGRNTVSRVLFQRRELTEFCGKLGEFCQKLGEFAFAHK